MGFFEFIRDLIIYDKDGYNKNGFDKNGYNKNGYNLDGYDRFGYNLKGYNRNGYNKGGYDEDGYHVRGYDRKGYDRKGFNEKGYDKNGYNNKGYDKDGFNISGYSENGYSRNGYDKVGYDKNGYNREGYDEEQFDKEGWHKLGMVMSTDNIKNEEELTNFFFGDNDGDEKLSAIDKLHGSIDHITHLINLKSILTNGLLSHYNPYKKIDISNVQVNDRRNKLEPIYNRNLHDYVPFYMNARNAMLYRNQKEHGNLIIILGFRKELVLSENIVFTDGNAASDVTRYFNDINYLFKLDWSSIRSDRWHFDGYRDDEIKRKMMTEVLVYEKVDISYLENIYCQSNIVKQYIEQHFSLDQIKVETKQSMFFERLIRV